MAKQKQAELLQLIKQRFPSLRLGPPQDSSAPEFLPTGWGKLDVPLGGGLPCGSVTEVVIPNASSGSGLLQASMLRRTARSHRWMALLDAADAFDPASLPAELLTHLLWVRCRNANQAMKCVDVLARDGNVPLIVLDLVLSPAAELRRIPPNSWFRLQRLMEGTNRALLVMTPVAFVGSAQARIKLKANFGLESLLTPQENLLAALDLEWLRKPNRTRSRLEAIKEAG